MPRLWTETIETHRQTVHDAILDAAASLVAEHGLRGVTMAQIAERSGIGRATLYKYFQDVDAMLDAWHSRLVDGHLAELADLRAKVTADRNGVAQILEAYALLRYPRESHSPKDPHEAHHHARLHASGHLGPADAELSEFMRSLLADAAANGAVRDDVPPAELAAYCLHALTAARTLRTKAAVRRLVELTLNGIAHRSVA